MAKGQWSALSAPCYTSWCSLPWSCMVSGSSGPSSEGGAFEQEGQKVSKPRLALCLRGRWKAVPVNLAETLWSRREAGLRSSDCLPGRCLLGGRCLAKKHNEAPLVVPHQPSRLLSTASGESCQSMGRGLLKVTLSRGRAWAPVGPSPAGLGKVSPCQPEFSHTPEKQEVL